MIQMRQSKLPAILLTKIDVPRLSVGVVERPRLLALLPQVRAKRLTLIKAAAGFGKTSVGVAWAEHLREAEGRVAWLGLDRDDDVPARLLYYVGHALERACGGLGSTVMDIVAEVSLLPIETAISALINELAEIDDDVFLFLDDYQNITDSTIHDGLTFLLKHASSNFHLVLISRADPPLPLAQLRAQNQLLELDASLLRFDLAETRRFVAQANIGQLNAAQVAMLHSALGPSHSRIGR
jgi:LuxR family maltose regulon positive regulatory protein